MSSKRRPKVTAPRRVSIARNNEEAMRYAINRRRSLMPPRASIAAPVHSAEEDSQRFTDLLMRSANSEKIGIDQIKLLCESTGYGEQFDSILKFLKTKDEKGTGFIDVADFAKLIDPSYNPFEEGDGLTHAFRAYDYNKTGYIEPENIKVIADECGENIPIEELEEMVALFSKSGDRAVDLQEFHEIMKLAGVNVSLT